MSLVVNNNMMAANAARNLNTSYSALSTSTERLSSGLRINSSSDDAAGLAVRELMRSDVATINQGVRNANDGISMIQTADGALSVVDEKLIRMKELAEQASTGTYTDSQRQIIDDEYQAMASEITRIASATDFNGIHLLNGNLGGTGMTIHFGTGNDEAEDKYAVTIADCSA
ncbi:MAG: flagellin, partial [Proteobacteria bacterium]|nr:flagellin [Pseudomonadota bacterium]